MEHKTLVENKPGIDAIKTHKDKQSNISGWLIVATSFLHSAYYPNSWIK
jgi:hypothetical protein